MNPQILSQDEVDALLQGLTGESATADGASRPAPVVRDYDLASQERIVRGRMPALESVNERFVRNLRPALGDFIQRTPEITAEAVKVCKFSQFLRETVVPSNFNLVAVRPLRGSGLLVCEPALVFAVIDALFGGSGKFPVRIEGRDFSPTEQRVILRLVELLIGEYNRAWQDLYPLELAYQRSEMQPQFAGIAAPGEVVVCSAFSVEIGDAVGTIQICVPYATLEPIRDVLGSRAPGDGSGVDRRWVSLLTDQIQAAEVELVAELAHAPATVEQLLAMQPGDFIELDLARTIVARVDGVPVLEAGYGTSHGRYALRVERVMASETLGWIGERHG